MKEQVVMCCPKCQSENVKKFGKDRNGNQRYRCRDCKKTFIEDRPRPLGSMRLDFAKAVYCLRMLLEGTSIRSCERLTGVNRNTLCDLILTVGERCKVFLADHLNSLPVGDIQVDEVWSYVGKKERTKIIQHDDNPERGDAYAYIGLERNTKLIVSWHLGKRSDDDTWEFARELQKATVGRFHLSTDGYKPYCIAMPTTLGPRIDYAQIIKVFTNPPKEDQRRYSPAQIVEIKRDDICGHPSKALTCTSHVERSNLTVRMTCRRWTRLTNAFSKSWKHHEAAMALYIAFYDFVRPHMTLKTTPAVAAKLTDHRWTMEELLTAIAA